MDAELSETLPRPDAGFTLIEVLIAVAVLAVLATGASLAATRGPSVAVSDAAAFAEVFDMQRRLAVQGKARRGLVLEGQGYRHAQYRDGQWQVSERRLPWRGRAVPNISNRASLPGAQLVVFLPNGRTSAGEVVFSAGGAEPMRCTFDGWTGATCGAL